MSKYRRQPTAGAFQNTPNFRFQKYEIPELDANHPLAIRLSEVKVINDLPDRTEEQKIQRQKMIDGISLIDDKAILIIRHKARKMSKSGIVTSLATEDSRIAASQTGTVAKVNPFYVKRVAQMLEGFGQDVIDEATLKSGDFVRFNAYAPFGFVDEFPEVQLLGYMDVLAKLRDIPNNVVED